MTSLPATCAALLVQPPSRSASHHQGSAGGGWSMCTHLINYGLNFDFGLASFMADVLQPTASLELGCGLGLYSDWMARKAHAAPAIGIEPSGIWSPVFKDGAWPQELAADFFSGDAATAACADSLKREVRFDLVFTIEVAEHIPRDRHPKVVDFLTSQTAKYLVFSAAQPGQKGVGHIAERTADEWQAEFESRGLLYMPNTTRALRGASSASMYDWNHRNNPLVFAHRDALTDANKLEHWLRFGSKHLGPPARPSIPASWRERLRYVNVHNISMKWRGMRLQAGEAIEWPEVVLSQRDCE